MFIVLEGSDCAGKTTQAKRLADRLRDTTGREVLHLSFPSDTYAGTLARDCIGNAPALLIQSVMTIDKYAFASQIRTCLRKGGIVVSDRWTQSAEVYGVEDGLDHDWLLKIHENLPFADLNILLDLDVATICSRLKERGFPPERYENGMCQARIVSGYRNLWSVYSKTPFGQDAWPVVDATHTADVIHEELFKLACQFLR